MRPGTQAALAALFLCACVGAPRSAPAAREASAPRPATERRAAGNVEVLLTEPSGRDALEVHDPVTGALTLERRGENVRARGEERGEWLLAPSPGASLRVGDDRYPGMVRVRAARTGGLEVRAVLDLEDYIAGVLAAELAVGSAPKALLEAQAVAARSYAVAELDHRARSSPRPYLFDDTRDMAYRGVPATAAGERVRAAVERTRGRVLRERGRVLDARFHAACGGRTARGQDVFPESGFESLRSVDCAPCREDAPPEWRTTATRAELDALARAAGAGATLARLRPAEVDPGGRWLSVAIEGPRGGGRLPFELLRRRLGPRRLQSALVLGTWPAPGEEVTGGLAFRGRGRGHGVGLCQRGARGYAERGWSAERILAHYYRGAELADGR